MFSVISAADSSASNSTIATLSAEVSGATSITDCTDAQKTTIAGLITSLDSAIDDVDSELASVQALLESKISFILTTFLLYHFQFQL